MRKIKLGIVGLGRGSCAGEQIRRRCRFLEITAICDKNENVLRTRTASFGAADAGQKLSDERTFSTFEGGTYLSYDEMLQKGDIEAVYIATPIPAHAEMVIKALNAGKHVISEVVCAVTLEDCRRIQSAIKQTGRKYMLAEQYCYIRPWTIAFHMAQAGLFGEIYYAEGNYLMDFTNRSGYPYIGGRRQNIYHMHRGHVYITHSLGPLAKLFHEDLKSVSSMGSGSFPRHW